MRWFIAAVCVICFCAPVGADDKDSSFDLSVWTIRATKSNSDVSPELKSIATSLKKQFNYTGFKLEGKKTGSAEKGKSFSVSLIGAFKAKITPLERKDKRIKLKIEITKKQGKEEKRLAGTTITLNSGRFQLLGGWKIDTKSEDALIVAVSAR